MICVNCQEELILENSKPIDPALKLTWKLDDSLERLFNYREGSKCAHCGINVRALGLARGLLRVCENKPETMQDWVKIQNKKKTSVLELNACHKLHDSLLGLENLTYSEYGTETQQDIQKLSYDSDMFDLVIHSETLEHVPDPKQAIQECRRVIKSDGCIIFTIPIIWNRQTHTRAVVEKNGAVKKVDDPSYHGQMTDDYLVFTEFGRDVMEDLGRELLYSDWRHQNYVFIARKERSQVLKPGMLLGLQIKERIAQALNVT